MDVPSTPTAIDPPWLNAVLAASPAFADTRIESVRATVIGEGFGLDGVVARLDLEASGGEPPRSIVAKGSGAATGRAEIAFYERIAPRMPVRLPRFYGGDVDEAADRAVLLLEDLTHAVQGDAVRGATAEQARVVLCAMARFHATFLEAGAEALPLPVWEANVPSMVERVHQRFPRFAERYGSFLDTESRRRLEHLPADLPGAAAVLLAARPTLIHTDLHFDNVLLIDPVTPVILDWPHARRGPAVLDVVRLLLEGMRGPGLRRHAGALLDAYARARRAEGRPWASPEAAAEQVRAAVTWHLARTMTWAGAKDPGFATPRVKEIVDALVENAVAATQIRRL